MKLQEIKNGSEEMKHQDGRSLKLNKDYQLFAISLYLHVYISSSKVYIILVYRKIVPKINIPLDELKSM